MTIENETVQSATPRPPKRPLAIVLVALASVALGSGATFLLTRPSGDGTGHAGEKVAEAKVQYQCPMHPTIVQDHPGDCPICGMKLVPMAAAAGEPSSPAPSATGEVLYQCPMHPAVQQHHPGDCPICGMKLEKVDPSGAFEVPPGGRKIVFYRSPMDPRKTSHTPRKDEMGMDYLPVYLDELQGPVRSPGWSR